MGRLRGVRLPEWAGIYGLAVPSRTTPAEELPRPAGVAKMMAYARPLHNVFTSNKKKIQYKVCTLIVCVSGLVDVVEKPHLGYNQKWGETKLWLDEPEVAVIDVRLHTTAHLI